MLTSKKNGDAIEVFIDSMLVLCIDERSDDEAVSLLFTPIKGIIVNTKKCTDEDMPWSHELLVSRRL